MTTKLFTVSLLAACLVWGTLAAQEQPKAEQPKTPKITKRQIHQQERIQQGVRSGKLTPQETRKLEREQAKIQRDKKKAKADGKVTPEEREKLRREQNKANRDIYRLKHNDRTQP